MGIVGNGDQRRIIKPNEPDFTRKPLPSIVAIDNDVIVNNQILPGYGTGIVISPSYILTAAHVIYEKDFGGIGNVNRIRVSSSGNQNRLVDRKIGMGQGDPGENVDVTTGLFYPTPQFLSERAGSTEESKHDIGLIEFNNNSSLVSPDLSVGLIAFMSSRTARGRSIQTAGYPVDNVPNTFPPSRLNNPGIVDRQGNQVNQPGDFSRFARDLVIAPGFPDAPGSIFSTNSRRIEYSDNIDTISGQSGSPLWHILEGDGEPRVLGVHSRGNNPRRNVGTLIDKEVYDAIIDRIEGDGNPDDLPENAIIGSDPSIIPVNTSFSSNGNDDIFGTYRKERILGKGGKNRLYGGGGNDRLEGGDREDQAIFTDVFTNYTWSFLVFYRSRQSRT